PSRIGYEKMPLQELFDRILLEIHSAWRFRWYGITLAWAAFGLGWVVIALLPNVFEAHARVFVDTSSALRPVLSNQIIPVDVGTQLSYVRQSLLGRPQLEKVATANRLAADALTQ